MSFRLLLVDDEELARVKLRYLLAAHPQWQIAAECASAAQACTVLADTSIDLVLLDIQMPGQSGLDLARTLCTRQEPPLIIFVTAFNQYALEAFDVHALDYLQKPVSGQRLALALARASELLTLRQRAPYGAAVRAYLQAEDRRAAGQPQGFVQQLTVRSVGKIEWVRIADVLWMNAANNYVELHTAQRCILHRQALNRLELGLDPASFLRVHRSTIVRIDQMAALSVIGDGSYRLSLHCGAQLDVSERHVGAVRARCG